MKQIPQVESALETKEVPPNLDDDLHRPSRRAWWSMIGLASLGALASIHR